MKLIIILIRKILEELLFGAKRIVKLIFRFPSFIKQYNKFLNSDSNRFQHISINPYLFDRTSSTDFDAHYLYHVAWAIRKIILNNPVKHVDISSSLNFCANISAFIPTIFYDFRPAKISLTNLTCDSADLLDLKFADDSIESLSCMHVIEHVGLGSYGDRLDCNGDLKAISEIKRVLSHNGLLYFVVPVSGKSRVEFNAHRVYSLEQIKSYFSDLELIEHALITDDRNFIENPEIDLYDEQFYGCGCFIFKKTDK